ncbi:hypothetical protein DB29_00052 [Shouchella clausii]|nr:hypothetical protein DB29_00052 [Shouchella clausii]
MRFFILSNRQRVGLQQHVSLLAALWLIWNNVSQNQHFAQQKNEIIDEELQVIAKSCLNM